ncbi:MAG: bacteriohopanetetrol glucosamine biosynthesis glycosyltransferase HpnI [Bryobacterales bacterium]|nr:bacteriohopanetetrol glucosamine biosynthesis glycosyltransferase HpnI [Bryobacterales bacterium]
MLSVAMWACAALAAGGTVFYALVAVASWRHARKPAPPAAGSPLFSILKPLAGLDLGLAENLRSYFAFDYARYELLFGVHREQDPAAAVARAEIVRHDQTRAELIVSGDPPSLETHPNAKNWTLLQLSARAQGEILVIADSDVRAAPHDLAILASDFADPRVGVVTCPYRAVPGPSLWSKLEAIGMNTEFWGGALVAQMLAPMDFAVGPTMAIRRTCLDALGGFESTRDFLAEDFVLGNRARETGWEVTLSSCVVEHRIGAQSFGDNMRHRVRWYRSTRCSRPAGYLAQIFTYPLPFAALTVWLAGGAVWSWWLLGACAVLRLIAALATARTLHDTLVQRNLHWLPVQDAISFAVWCVALFGRKILWRGRAFEVTADGRLRALR